MRFLCDKIKQSLFPLICLSFTFDVCANGSVLPENFAVLPDDVQALLLEYAFFNDQVNQHWGEQASFASQTAYVKYLDAYLSRATVDCDQGILTVETFAII